MRLATFIQANTRRIAEEWEGFARSLAPGSGELSKLVLRDHIDEILDAIARDMREPQSPAEQAEKGTGQGGRSENGDLDQAGQQHAGQRIDVGFKLDQTAAEFRALRASIVRLWEESSPETAPSDRGDLIRFNEAIDQIFIESMNSFTRKLDRYREQFLAVLGHDLRNPLGAILMSADLLSRAEDLDARHARTVTRILNSAERMNRLLSDLLDLTRARLGAGLPMTRGPMDLETVCRQVLDELEAFHPDRVLRFEPSGDLRGEWDAQRIAQVVSNLTANALQHGDKAAPILVSARPEGEQVMLLVHNEGPPIPPQDLGKVFEPLVQSEGAAQAKAAGSLGLGLFIVQEVVTAHGGEVSVTSTEAQGTTFTVRLPRRAPPRAGEAPPDRPP